MSHQLAPIILFVYNRPYHTKQTLEALARNPEAGESLLYIFCDAAKEGASAHALRLIDEVREMADSEGRFKEVYVDKAEKNRGLAGSIIRGVTSVVEQHGMAIILEDDMVTSTDFLSYMNQALRLYENEPQVACISGSIYPVEQELPQSFFIKGADCWGWATWKRAWDVYDGDGQKLLNAIHAKGRAKEFDFGGTYPYTQMLAEQVRGGNNSWAVRWYASSFLKNMLCLYPGRSLVHNIGLDGSGEHSGVISNMSAKVDSEGQHLQPISVKEDETSKAVMSEYFKVLHKKPSRFTYRRIVNYARKRAKTMIGSSKQGFDQLVQRILKEDVLMAKPPVLLDVGASGEIYHKWSKIAHASICVAFDADEREFEVTSSDDEGYKNLIRINRIVTDKESAAGDFYLTESPFCSSALEPDVQALTPWKFGELFRVEKKVQLPTITLSQALEESGLDYVDWYKADSQGTDLRLFLSLDQSIRGQMSAADFEPGLIDAYKGEDKVADVLKSLDQENFWISSFEARGVPRVHPRKYKSIDPFLRQSPCWAGITALRTTEGAEYRTALLLILFAILEGQWGFALEVCDSHAARYEPLSGIKAQILKIMDRHKSMPGPLRKVESLARKVKRVFINHEEGM